MVRDKPLALIAIVVFGLALRLLYLNQHIASPYFEPLILDPNYYHEWALRLLQGKWIQETAFFGLPLYPMFLSLIYKLSGTQILAVKFFQQCIGILNILLIYFLTQRLFAQKRISLMAALMSAFYGPYLFHETILIPEALAVALYTCVLLGVICFWDRPSRKKAIFLGLLFALAGCTKAGLFLFLPVFILFYLFRHGALRPFHDLRH